MVPAPPRRHQPGHGVVRHRPGVPGRRGAGRRARARSLHAPDELLPAAYALAQEIAENTSAVSVSLTRALLWRMLGEDHPMAAHRVDSALIDATGASPMPARASSASSRSARRSGR